MLTLINSSQQTPDSVDVGIQRIVALALQYLNNNPQFSKIWDGDQINVKSQFPLWVQQEYDTNPAAAPVIDFFTYYYRWLFDYDEGYGCGFYLENLRDITSVKSAFLQAYADEVFSQKLDLSVYPELSERFRTFYLCHARDYVHIKGTPTGIEYLLKTLFGATVANAVTTGPTSILITTDITNSTYQTLIKNLACPFSFTITFVTP